MSETSPDRKKILIGFLSNTIKGSIPTITNVFVEGLKNNFNIVPFYMERKMGKKALASLNLLNLFYFVKHFVSWCRAIVINKPDIVHFPVTSYWNMEKSLIFLGVAKLLGAKYTVGHLHGGAFIEFWQQLSSFRKEFALKQMIKLDLLIVLSDVWKQNVVQSIGIPEEKVVVLHNVIDYEFEDHFRNFRRDYSAKPVVTLLGFNLMDSRKGIFDLLEALALLEVGNNYELVVIGDEREPGVFDRAGKMIEEKKLLNVKLLKGLWGIDKINWFEKADVLILPSHIENFPVVVLEAASAGMPVIASSIGALPDIFKHEVDILFIQPKDVTNLAKHISSLINSPDERQRLGENIKKTFYGNLAGKKVIERLSEIYRGLN